MLKKNQTCNKMKTHLSLIEVCSYTKIVWSAAVRLKETQETE